MGCGCNGSKNSANTSWVYTDSNGGTRVFSTEVEARAAMIRAGNTGSVSPG